MFHDSINPHKVIRPYIQSLPEETCVVCRNSQKITTRKQNINLGSLNPNSIEITICESCFKQNLEEIETRTGCITQQTPKITEFINIIYHLCENATASTKLRTITGDLELCGVTYITNDETEETKMDLRTYLEEHSEQVELSLTNTMTNENISLIQDTNSESAIIIFNSSGVTLVIDEFTRTLSNSTNNIDYCCFRHFKSHLTTLNPLTKYIQKNSEVFTINKFNTQYRVEYISTNI